MTRSEVEALVLIKHLPPSASTLRLLDLSGCAGALLAQQRADLVVTVGTSGGEDSFDAVIAYGAALNDETLHAALIALRPGGRLIAIDPQGEPSAQVVKTLERAGYTRILVEEMLPNGVLMRGEKPHVSEDTLARIDSVASRDTSLPEFKGRYLHLLIRQYPNKPVWALKADDVVTWEAVALAEGELIAFSSLPNAVAFMQRAVIEGKVKDVNKVAKFTREAARDWRVVINPPPELLKTGLFVFSPVDPTHAEKPDE